MKRERQQRLEWQTSFVASSTNIEEEQSVKAVSKSKMVVTDLESKEGDETAPPLGAKQSRLKRADTTLGFYVPSDETDEGVSKMDRLHMLTNATARTHPLDQAVNATPYLASLRITKVVAFCLTFDHVTAVSPH